MDSKLGIILVMLVYQLCLYVRV